MTLLLIPDSSSSAGNPVYRATSFFPPGPPVGMEAFTFGIGVTELQSSDESRNDASTLMLLTIFGELVLG